MFYNEYFKMIIRYLDGASLSGANNSLENARAGTGTTAHLTLERRQLAGDTLLRLESVLKVALSLAPLRLFTAHLFLGLIQLPFQSLNIEISQ